MLLAAHGEYCSIANFRAKIPAMFWGHMGFFAVCQNFVYLCHDFLRNPWWCSEELCLGQTGRIYGTLTRYV
jgi:hypothetical protein